MSSEFQVEVKDTEPSVVAFITVEGPYSQIQASFGALYGWIGGRGFIPSGPPSGVYYNSPKEVPPQELLWEIRSPIAGDMAEMAPDAAGLGVKRVGSVRVASALHHGPYDQVGKSYGAMADWMARNGYEMAGPIEEVYLSEPEIPAEQQMAEIRFPIR